MSSEQLTEHEPPSSISNDDNPFKLDRLTLQLLSARSSQNLPSIMEHGTRNMSLAFPSIQDDAERIVSNGSIDAELSAFDRKISLSESDLLASLHRTVNKQLLDNQSDHETTDDILFLEWDKERNLFQDYINSLRKEIRVLLQERSEYRTSSSPSSSSEEQTKVDLLHNSLEEKNLVVEQLQTDYDLMKEKNMNLSRQISILNCDARSHLGIIDEVKQKLADLTVDLQNHVLVKRRLEISINNLESDCKLIDAERVRLLQDVKESQQHKQELEKSMQKAQVRIAEQGSTIEMLRSENIQVRSQLSTVQRRMFQEKQQLMDYLRQIESELVEKEQIKQREYLLRQEYEELQSVNKKDRKEIEQLNNAINQDRVKIQKLEEECSHLFKAIQTKDENNIQLQSELDKYTSTTKRFYSRFQVPFDAASSLDQLIPLLEERYRSDNSTQIPLKSSLVDSDEVRNELERLTLQCQQLEEANRAWSQHQQQQLIVLADRFQLTNATDLSFDGIVQGIIDRFTALRAQYDTPNPQAKESQGTTEPHTDQKARVHDENELNQLREQLIALTENCTLLSEANLGWQQFHASQLENFRHTFGFTQLTENDLSFDQMQQALRHQLIDLEKQREDLRRQLNEAELAKEPQLKLAQVQRSSPTLLPNPDEVELRQLQQTIDTLTVRCAQLEEDNRAWQQSRQTEIDQFRSKLQEHVVFDEHRSLDQLAQRIVEQLSKQAEHFERALETMNEDRQLESSAHRATMDRLAEELVVAKEQCEDAEMINRELRMEMAKSVLPSDGESDLLQDYIDEISTLSTADLADRLKRDCHMVLSRRNVQLSPLVHDDLNRMALIALHSIYQQHLADEAKQLYDETVLRALREECESMSNEKNDLFEEIKSIREKNQRDLTDLQSKYDELLDVERADAKQRLDDLIERYESEATLAQNHDRDWNGHGETLNSGVVEITNDYEQLVKESNHLRDDLHRMISENELLKEYNSQMYQERLQGVANKDSIDAEIQCNLRDDLRSSNTHDSADDRTNPTASLDGQPSPTHGVDRLTRMIEEIRNENQGSTSTHSSNYNSRQHQGPMDLNQSKEGEQAESNGWNDPHSSFDFPVDDMNIIPKATTGRDIRQTMDSETQTVEQTQDKLAQVNSKLKRALQTIKDKIHRVVLDRPDLFLNSQEDTIERLDHLIVALENQASEIDRLKADAQPPAPAISASEIEQLMDERNQAREESIRWQDTTTDDHENEELKAQIAERDRQLQEFAEKYSALESKIRQYDIEQYQNQIDVLMEQQENLLTRNSQLEQSLLHKSSDTESVAIDTYESVKQTPKLDRGTQTEEQGQDKLSQVNSKLKRALQSLKEKIHRVVVEHPDLFLDTTDDTLERLDHLAVSLRNQSSHTAALQNERDLLRDEMDRLQSLLQSNRDHVKGELSDGKHESMSNASVYEQYQKLMDQWQHARSQKDDETASLRDRLDEVQGELKQALEDHASVLSRCEALTKQQETLAEQYDRERMTKQREMDRIREEIDQRPPLSAHEDAGTQTVDHYKDQQVIIDQQRQEVEQLTTENASLSAQLADYGAQVAHLTEQHATASVAKTDQEKLTQMNGKLKRALQSLKEKIHRVVAERPDLFVDAGDETGERLDHLIAKVEQQATQIDVLHVERRAVNEQLQEQISELQSALTSAQAERDNERQMAASSRANISSELSNEYQTTIDRLQQNLLKNDEERALLRDRIHTMDLEIKQLAEDHTFALANCDADRLHEIEQLQKEMDRLRGELTDLQHRPDTTHEEIRQQGLELTNLKSQCLSLSEELTRGVELRSVLESEKEESEAQVASLTQQRAGLLDQIAEHQTAASVAKTDQEKLTQMNGKLKRALQSLKEKIHRVVAERPDLFVDAGDETGERLDHLIAKVEQQATQIDALQVERHAVDEQLQHQIGELRDSLEAARYQLENERPVKMDQLVCASPPMPSSEPSDASLIEDYEKQIDQLRQRVSQRDEERALLRDHLNEVELELQRARDEYASIATGKQAIEQERTALVEQHQTQTMTSQREIEHLRTALFQLQQRPVTNHAGVQTVEDIRSLHLLIGQQCEQLKDLETKNEDLISQMESQVASLTQQRASLLVQIAEHHAAASVAKTEQEKLTQMNGKMERALQSLKEKIHRVVAERPDLFVDVGDETGERLDHLIAKIEEQSAQMNSSHRNRERLEEQLQREIRELKDAFDTYQQQIDTEYRTKLADHVSSSKRVTDHTETQTDGVHESPLNSATLLDESDDDGSNGWFDASPVLAEKEERQSEDIGIQCRLLDDDEPPSGQESPITTIDRDSSEPTKMPLSLVDNETQTDFETMAQDSSETLEERVEQIIRHYPQLFPDDNENPLERLNDISSIIAELQDELAALRSSSDAYRNEVETQRSIEMERQASRKPTHAHTQTLGLSMMEEHRQQIDTLRENELLRQGEIDRLIEERDQSREALSQWKKEQATKEKDYASSYQTKIRERDEQVAQLCAQLRQQQDDRGSSRSLNSIESQTSLDMDSSTADSQLNEYASRIETLTRERLSLIEQLDSRPQNHDMEIQTIDPTDQSISRRVFEEEMLAWSKESEQLRRFVKQIQVENKKLKEIVFKFERMVLDYVHENETLKQENHRLSSNTTSSATQSANDAVACSSTVNWLTYKAAQQSLEGENILSSSVDDGNDEELRQRAHDTDRQLKAARVQNERLKNQVDTFTMQFKHVQHEINVKIQEMSTLKEETERLRSDEIKNRSEFDRLKADFQDGQLKIQQLERELVDMKLGRSSSDANSIDNLRELLELKERELKALKDKLDYAKQSHQLELKEALKANQFSLDNVRRHEQTIQRHEEKQRDLETRLGQFCAITKPLLDNPQLFIGNAIVSVAELRRLITAAETQERVTASLSPIRDCLSLLEAQMKDLHHNIIENHARRSKRWKYKLGFECLSCESRWEVTHDIRDLQEACLDPNRFLESSIVEPMAGCSCPIMIDFVESDIRLCLEDLLDDVISRETVK